MSDDLMRYGLFGLALMTAYLLAKALGPMAAALGTLASQRVRTNSESDTSWAPAFADIREQLVGVRKSIEDLGKQIAGQDKAVGLVERDFKNLERRVDWLEKQGPGG